MESNDAVTALAALAHPSRLAVFRLLVEAGLPGVPAGRISEQLQLPPSSLTFHLKELHHAGLVDSQQQGRFVIYRANFAAMSDLVGFLTENCCAGQTCGPQPETVERPKRESPPRRKGRAT
jgi:ArsR family transcriptional regulator, arsenate/arsenite/antimonite-responsive transcriptional repressor